MTIGERYEGILSAACGVIARRGFHQASIRELARAAGLSVAGLYHYVGEKDELLFLVLGHALDRLLEGLRQSLAAASTAEERLLALIRTHLEFGFHHGHALRIINRDHDLLAEPRRSEIGAKRRRYLDLAMAVLRELDPQGRSDAELFSATNLLLGMLNGVATRPFLRSATDVQVLAGEIGALFLHGFLARSDRAEEARRPALLSPA